ncbi:hydroxyproline-rich glycoprotein family protein [Perilla frutescens var. hirtella]|nr:hydroxyproline-rich glycoprotein family protein [Perilla frutescens var. frutescens]KAH6791948.1 hydroxyproline-rich glycoprotein family protein [Perilla frutescens var. hirtella]
MDRILQTLPNSVENSPPNLQNTPPPPPPPACNPGRNGTPDRLKVPKPFKHPERYASPTDQMMSPVSRGILARGRKGSKLLPPSANHHKIQALKLQESMESSPISS